MDDLPIYVEDRSSSWSSISENKKLRWFELTNKQEGRLKAQSITESRKEVLFSKLRTVKLYPFSCTHTKSPFYVVVILDILQWLFLFLTGLSNPMFFIFYLATIGIRIPILLHERFLQFKVGNQIKPLELIRKLRQEKP